MNACQVFVLGMAVAEQSCITRDGPADPEQHLARVTVSREEPHLTVWGGEYGQSVCPSERHWFDGSGTPRFQSRTDLLNTTVEREEQGGSPISVSAGSAWLHFQLCQAQGLLCPLTRVAL